MTINIDQVRLSFVQVVVVPELLTPEARSRNWSRPFLADFDSYQQWWNQAQYQSPLVAAAPTPLLPPWPAGANGSPPANSFWHYYLDHADLGSVSSNTAWSRAVPLRLPADPALKLSLQGLNGAAWLELFLYPQGVVCILNMKLTLDGSVNPVDPIAAATAAVTARQDPVLTFVSGAGPFTSSEVISKVLDQFKQSAGPNTSTPLLLDPFTVTTVIHATGAPLTPVTYDDEIHRMLAGMARLRDGFQNESLNPVAQSAVMIGRHSAASLVFGSHNGRSVWFPEMFPQPNKKARTLGSFHRNLVLASMQSNALLGLAAAAQDWLVDSHALSFDGSALARNASKFVGLLHGGAQDVYRSGSVKRQIDDSGMVDRVDALRRYFGFVQPIGGAPVTAAAPVVPPAAPAPVANANTALGNAATKPVAPAGIFVLKRKRGGKYVANLLDADENVLMSTDPYATMTALLDLVATVRTSAPGATVEDQTDT